MLQKIISALLALSLTIFAVADDGIVIAADIQPADIAQSDVSSDDDSMTGFLAVISAVPTTDLTDTPNTTGSNHRRHLGLGFTHGMANINVKNAGTVHNSGNNNIGDYVYGTDNNNVNPHNDACSGNGHPGNISNGNSGNSNTSGNNGNNGNGNGHFNPSNGNGFGHTDCGEPSPSD